MIRRLIRRPRWAILISGRGSNLQVWLDHAEFVDVEWVVSSKATAPGLLKAQRRGIQTAVLPKLIDWQKFHFELKKRNITHLLLAGFMKLIPADFVNLWSGRILNIHPSLLPAFPGLHSLQNSYAAGASMGITVHHVSPEMDAGPIIFQKSLKQKTIKNTFVPWSWSQVQTRATLIEHHLMREVILKWS